MSRNIYWRTAIAALLGHPLSALAARDADLQSLGDQIQRFKQSNAQLEQRLQQDEMPQCSTIAAVPLKQREQLQPRRVDYPLRHL